MNDLLERLAALEEIRQLKSRYFRYIDTKDWEALRGVFCDDAEFDARTALSLDGAGEGAAAESNDWVYRGGDIIVEFIRTAVSPRRSVHHGHGHEIEILSIDEARGVVAMEDRVWDGETPFLHGYGHYHERYRRTPDGWRILTSRISRLYVKLG